MNSSKQPDKEQKPPKWPSLDEQLRESNVKKGTELEKLVRNNQELHLLHPKEMNDQAGIPPWLRVYWRKSHPDVSLSSVNPGASYPEALHRLHAWMMAHQDLPSTPKAPKEGGEQ